MGCVSFTLPCDPLSLWASPIYSPSVGIVVTTKARQLFLRRIGAAAVSGPGLTVRLKENPVVHLKDDLLKSMGGLPPTLLFDQPWVHL